MIDSTSYAPWLWLCTVLLFLRVVGQLIVVLASPSWLLPMDQWQSGLLRYRVLLPGQAIVLTLMVWISVDFTRGSGMFVASYPGRGHAVLWFSYVYFGGMVVRYIIRMWRRPDQRWFGGTIPIIFHSVMAAFIFVFATYHLRMTGS